MPPEAAAPVTVIGGGGIGGPVAASLALAGEIERGEREMSWDNLRLLEEPASWVVASALSGDVAGTSAV
jgi:hypothetical protein